MKLSKTTFPLFITSLLLSGCSLMPLSPKRNSSSINDVISSYKEESSLHVHTNSSPVKENEVAATCTREGSYDMVVYCTICRKELSRNHYTAPALGHDYVKTGESEATYEFGPSITYVCSRCKDIKNETSGDPLPHNFSEEWYIDEEKGTHYHVCLDPGYEDLRGSESLHDGEWIIDQESTIFENGSRHITCSICGYTIRETLYATGTPEKLDFFAHYDRISRASSYQVRIKDQDISGDVVIPSYYNGLPVTSLYGDSSFSYCSNITSLVIPDSVTDLGDYSFAECGSLVSVKIGNGATKIGKQAFIRCRSLKNIELGNNITEIGEWAFFDCSSLRTLVVPNKVTTIGTYAFTECNSLVSVTIGSNVTTIGDSAFICPRLVEIINLSQLNFVAGSQDYGWIAHNAIEIIQDPADSKLTIEEDYVTYNDGTDVYLVYIKEQTKIKVPYGVTKLTDRTFSYFEKMVSVEFPETLRELNNKAFYDCYRLTEVINKSSIPMSLPFNAFDSGLEVVRYVNNDSTESRVSIDNDGFVTYNDGDLWVADYLGDSTRLTIPSRFTKINHNAFLRRQSIISITLPETITFIAQRAFCDCEALTSINIPSAVKTLEHQTFLGCSSLANIELHEGITSIGSYALSNTAVETLVIPDNVTTIGRSAFWNDWYMREIVLPSSLVSISETMFESCKTLNTIRYKGTVAQWNALEKGYGWKNEVPETCVVSCADGVISI